MRMGMDTSYRRCAVSSVKSACLTRLTWDGMGVIFLSFCTLFGSLNWNDVGPNIAVYTY